MSYQLNELRQIAGTSDNSYRPGQWSAGDLMGLGFGMVVLFGAISLVSTKLGDRPQPVQMAKSKVQMQLDQSPPTGKTMVIAGKAYTSIYDNDATASIKPAEPAPSSIRRVGSAYSVPSQSKPQNQASFIQKYSQPAQAKPQIASPAKTRLSQAETTSTKGLSPIRALPMPKPAEPDYWDKR